MKIKKITSFFLSVFICFLAGGVGSYFTFPEIKTWYVALQKPFFNPPNWVFGPVWSLLYLMMAVSLYLVWETKSKKNEKQQGLYFFFIQLVLNSLWSIVFFGLHSPFFSLIIIISLWSMILFTLLNFMKINKTAGWLLVPYLAWVSFATVLNFSVVILNW